MFDIAKNLFYKEPNKIVVHLDYFDLGKDLLITASCPTKNDAIRLSRALNAEFYNKPYGLSYLLNSYCDEEIYVVKAALEESQEEKNVDLFHVPGEIGCKAYIILKESAKSYIAEGIIQDITCRKRNDSFSVKFLVNIEDGLCITSKEVLYGIDGFVTEEEAKAALALVGQ